MSLWQILPSLEISINQVRKKKTTLTQVIEQHGTYLKDLNHLMPNKNKRDPKWFDLII